MTSSVRVHIGVHRTGTTALQAALGHHRPILASHGVTFARGHVLPDNHIELAIAALRPNRLAEAVPFFDHLIRTNATEPLPPSTDTRWTELAQELAAGENVVLSTEALAWLRHDDEVERLLAIMGCTPDIVVVHREKSEFLESYFQVVRFATLRGPDGPDSLFYTGPNAWMADRAARIDMWRRAVGDSHLVALDYDNLVATEGSTVPAVAHGLGIDPALLGDDAHAKLNRRSALPTKGEGGGD